MNNRLEQLIKKNKIVEYENNLYQIINNNATNKNIGAFIHKGQKFDNLLVFIEANGYHNDNSVLIVRLEDNNHPNAKLSDDYVLFHMI